MNICFPSVLMYKQCNCIRKHVNSFCKLSSGTSKLPIHLFSPFQTYNVFIWPMLEINKVTPDIGCIFRYKDHKMWEFSVFGISHTYTDCANLR